MPSRNVPDIPKYRGSDIELGHILDRLREAVDKISRTDFITEKDIYCRDLITSENSIYIGSKSSKNKLENLRKDLYFNKIRLTNSGDLGGGTGVGLVAHQTQHKSGAYDALNHDDLADVHQDVNTDASPTFAGLTQVGAAANKMTVAADGEIGLEGTARVKREFTIQAVNLDKGSLGPDAVILGNTLGYSYDIGDDSVLSFEIPYDCDTSEDIKIEIYWYINEAYVTNSGEVQWRIQWSACPANGTEAIDAPTHTGTIDFGDQDIPATAKFLTEKSGLIAAASISDGDFVSMTLDRVALDGGVDPTADPVIVQIEVEYTSNKLGQAT